MVADVLKARVAHLTLEVDAKQKRLDYLRVALDDLRRRGDFLHAYSPPPPPQQPLHDGAPSEQKEDDDIESELIEARRACESAIARKVVADAKEHKLRARLELALQRLSLAAERRAAALAEEDYAAQWLLSCKEEQRAASMAAFVEHTAKVQGERRHKELTRLCDRRDQLAQHLQEIHSKLHRAQLAATTAQDAYKDAVARADAAALNQTAHNLGYLLRRLRLERHTSRARRFVLDLPHLDPVEDVYRDQSTSLGCEEAPDQQVQCDEAYPLVLV